jgi:acyl dehydratase
MSFDLERLARFRRTLEQTYTVRDTILYALGVGAGIDASTPQKLRYVCEQVAGLPLQALPTLSCVLAAPGFWMREEEFGIEWRKILHAEQSVMIHSPLPAAGRVHSELSIEAIHDKGKAKGALVRSLRTLYNEQGDLLATLRHGAFLRGNGGQGGTAGTAPPPHEVPAERLPDHIVALPTRSEQGLIYRLSGDYNPLHADPDAARLSGFTGPILHGLASYGMAGRALLCALCEDDGSRLKRLDGRFSSPVFPGETLVTEIWSVGAGVASFQSRSAERDVVVISNGYAEYE